MADIIQIRRDVSSRWTNVNPVLAEGEFAVELDNLPFKIKMGNGLSSYNQLPYLITPARVILGADTLNLGDVYFSNANNVSFNLIGSSIQASASFSQSVQTQNLVTIQNSTGNISFINSNNISFGGSNGQITASFAYTQSTGPSAFAASNSTITSGTLYFSNANNVNFGLTNNSLTASVIQSVQPVAFSGSNGSALFSTLSFGNLNGLTFYTSNGSLVGSYSVPTDYVSTNQSSLFQQTSQMSDYLGANYTSHTHSQYLNTSQSSLFQQTSQMSDYALANHTHSQYLNTSQSSLFQHTSATSNITSNALHSTSPRVFNILLATNAAGGGTASLSSNVSLGNLNGFTFYSTNGSVVGSYTTPPAQTVQPVAASGSNGSFAFSTLSFGGSNGLSFYTTNGSIVGSYTVPAFNQSQQPMYYSAGGQSTSANTIQFGNSNGVTFSLSNGSIIGSVQTNYLTTAAQSNQTLAISLGGNSGTTNSSVIQNGGFVLAGGNNITLSQSNNSISIYGPAVGGGGITNINLSAGTTSNNLSNFVLGNANGITFGLNGSTVTASHNGLTQQSTQPVAASGSNGSFAFSTLSFGNSNGLNFYTTNGSIVGSYTVPTQTVQPVAVSGSNGSFNFSTLSFGQSNGLTFYTTNGSIVASYTVPTQTVQPVAASGSNGSFNFSTLSFGSSNGFHFYTTNGSIVGSYTLPTQSVQTQNMVSIQGSTGNITFANSNGITFGFNASTITASHNGITSQTNQNLSLFGLGNTTQNSSTVLGAANLSFNAIGSLTVGYSNGSIQLSAPNALTSQSNQAFSGSNASSTFQTISFGSSNGMHFYLTNGSLVGSYTVPSQTVQPVAASGSNGSFNFSTLSFGSSNGMHFYTTNGSVVGSYTVPSQTVQPVAASGSNGSFAYSTLSFGNLNGLSFYTSNGSLVASHNAITSQSNQNISLYALGNTTQNSSTVLNASQLSFNGLGNATVGFSNGSIQISVTGGGGGVTPAASASNGSFNFTTLAFSNANNVTFGTSAGGIITASVAAPGAAAENNWFNLLGANTAGNTTVSGSTIGMSALNLTLSGTNGSQMVLSAPATSSLSATGQLSISVNGSTISMGVPAEKTYNIWEPLEMRNNTAFSALGQNSIYIQKLWPQEDYSFGSIEQHASLSFVSSTNSQAVAYTWNYGVYARDTGTNSSRMTLSASSQMIFQASYNSNTAAGFTISGGGTSYTQTSAGTGLFTNITAGRHIYFPFAISFSAGGEYAVAWRVSSASTVGTSPLRMSVMVFTNINNLTWGKLFNSTISATNASFVEDFGQGVFSATSAALATSYAESQLTNAVSRARQYLMFE